MVTVGDPALAPLADNAKTVSVLLTTQNVEMRVMMFSWVLLSNLLAESLNDPLRPFKAIYFQLSPTLYRAHRQHRFNCA